MRYHKIAVVDGVQIPVVSSAITLELDSSGVAVLVLLSSETLSGKLTIFAGLDGQVQSYFVGDIISCVQLDSKQQKVTVQEFSSRLSDEAKISLRTTNLGDVLTQIAEKAGVNFAVSNDILTTSTTHFVNLYSAREAVNEIGKICGIDDFTILNNPDGSIYLGSLAETKLQQNTLVFSASFFTNVTPTSADCNFLPALRPGVKIRIGDSSVVTVYQVSTSNEKIHIKFEEL